MPVMYKMSDLALATLSRPFSCNFQALQAVNSFSSEYPSFKIVVRSYNWKHCNVVGSYFLFFLSFRYQNFKPQVQIFTMDHCLICIQTIPRRFFRRYIEHRAEHALLQVADRMYPVQFKPATSSGSITLSIGWRAFAAGNFLEGGDVCIFELIKNNILKVTIFRDVYQNA